MIWASAALLCCVGSNLMRGRGGGVWERAFPADTVYVRPYMRRRGTWQACACATIDAFFRVKFAGYSAKTLVKQSNSPVWQQEFWIHTGC